MFKKNPEKLLVGPFVCTRVLDDFDTADKTKELRNFSGYNITE